LLQIEADHKNNPYLKDLGRRALDGMLNTAREGFWTGQKAPLGYRVVKNPGDHPAKRRRKSGRLEIHPETGPVVRELFERYRDGTSGRGLTRWLSARTGRKWSRSGMQKILAKEIYTRTRVFGGRTSGRHAHLVDGQAVIMGCEEDGSEPSGAEQESRGPDVVRIAAYPAIVDVELFQAVQMRLTTGKQRSHKKNVPIKPLSGLCRCGVCGSPMYSSQAGPYPYLVCRRKNESGVEDCLQSRYVRGEEVRRRVMALLSEKLLAGDTVAELVRLAGQAEDEARSRYEANVNSARRAVEMCDARLAAARRRMAEAPDDLLEDYQKAVRELKEEKATAEADLARLRTEQPLAQEGDAELLTRWLESCRNLCQGSAPADGAEHNAILRELVAEIRVFPPAKYIKGKQTVGRVEVVLPDWLSRVLNTTAGNGLVRSP
jgi:hypothetical protein